VDRHVFCADGIRTLSFRVAEVENNPSLCSCAGSRPTPPDWLVGPGFQVSHPAAWGGAARSCPSHPSFGHLVGMFYWYVLLWLYNTGQDTECIEKDREKVSEKRFMMTEILSGKFQGFKAFR